jgi:hypothetical protein
MSGVAALRMSHCEPWIVNRWALRTLLGRAETLVSEPHDVYAFRQAVALDGLDLDDKDADQRLRLTRAIAHAADELRVEFRDSDDPRDRAFAERLDVLRMCLSELAGPGRPLGDLPIGEGDDVAELELNARPVDPRDTSWEVRNPAYRVCFWRRFGGGWASREFEVSGADAAVVFDWAERNAGDDETYSIFVLVGDGDARGLVRLAGLDPTGAHRSSDSGAPSSAPSRPDL